MAERLANVVTQIRNVRQLEAVVTAMRGIAASRAQQAQSLRDGIDAYSQVISRAIGQALNLLAVDTTAAAPLRRHRLGLILFCAEQGFAGAFSERVLDAAADDLAGATALVVGTRGAAVAAERGVAPAWTIPMANHVERHPAVRQPARRRAVWLCGRRRCHQGRHCVLAVGGRRRHSHRSPFTAAHRLQKFRASGGEGWPR